MGRRYTSEHRWPPHFMVIQNLYDEQEDISGYQDIALFKDSFFAERHANILNVWGDKMDTFGYIVESSSGFAIVKQIVRAPFDTTEYIVHATFRDIEDAENYVIQKNIDLMFNVYEEENRAKIH